MTNGVSTQNDSSAKLIIGIDIGTRLSAVSYVYIPQGQSSIDSKAIQHVMEWPKMSAKARRDRLTTVPSLMYYSSDGTKYGYDANNATRSAGYNPRLLVKEFKRAVHRLATNNIPIVSGSAFDKALQDSDAGITLKDVYTEWLKFLVHHASPQISKKYSAKSGQGWSTVWLNRIVVLVIPNGWGIPEQATLRDALMEAGAITKSENVRFIAESEVALHAAKGLRGFDPKKGTSFMVCDAGAATADIALYTVSSETPLKVAESKNHPSISVEAGLALAAEQADVGNYVQEKLDETEESSNTPVDSSTEAADAKFRDALKKEYGRVIKAIKEIKGIQQDQPQYLILGGGLFAQDLETFKSMLLEECNMTIIPRPHDVGKSASGVIQCALDRIVVARASAYAYGNDRLVRYDPNDVSHQGRELIKRPNGIYLDFGWQQVIAYGTVLDATHINSVPYYRLYRQFPDLSDVRIAIYAADQNVSSQAFIYDRFEQDLMPGFHHICTVNANLSALGDTLRPITFPGAGQFYKIEFTVEMAFYSSALHATISWSGPNGKEQTSVNLEEPQTWESTGEDLAAKAEPSDVPSDPSSLQGHHLFTAEQDGFYNLIVQSSHKFAELTNNNNQVKLGVDQNHFSQKWSLSTKGVPPLTQTTIARPSNDQSKSGYSIGHNNEISGSIIFAAKNNFDCWRLYQIYPDIYVITSVSTTSIAQAYVWTAQEDNSIRLQRREEGHDGQHWKLEKR